MTIRSVLLIVLVSTGAACTADNLTGPSQEPNVQNKVNEFRFQSRHLSPVTKSFTYTWVKIGTTIDVAHLGRIDSGEVHVDLRDPFGNKVFGRTDTPQISAWGGIFPLTTAGTWAIDVRLDGVVGLVDYRVTSEPTDVTTAR